MKTSAATLATMLALLGLSAACKREAPHSDPPGRSSSDPVQGSRACSSLTRLECYASSHCFLDHLAPFKYACREKRGPCEEGIRQTDRDSCEARPGCAWNPGSCYCPFAGYGETAVKDRAQSTGACACGGGPPAMCVKAGT